MNVLKSGVEVVDVFERAGVVDEVGDSVVFVVECVLTKVLDNPSALVVVNIQKPIASKNSRASSIRSEWLLSASGIGMSRADAYVV